MPMALRPGKYILEQMRHYHGFRELEMVDFALSFMIFVECGKGLARNSRQF